MDDGDIVQGPSILLYICKSNHGSLSSLSRVSLQSIDQNSHDCLMTLIDPHKVMDIRKVIEECRSEIQAASEDSARGDRQLAEPTSSNNLL